MQKWYSTSVKPKEQEDDLNSTHQKNKWFTGFDDADGSFMINVFKGKGHTG